MNRQPGTPHQPPRLSTGRARPVYLWAGNATIDLQRIKFPDIAIDKAAHLQAHEPLGAHVLAQTGINLAFLSMNWGFPPELEREHWREFERAVKNYQAAGISVLGYVQASNCVHTGTYASNDWYARDYRGRLVPYYHGRFMTCWNAPGWQRVVREHALRVLDAGAAGVFFDNVWMGGTPWTLGRAVGGFAGCACQRCRTAYRSATGSELPRYLNDDAASRQYLRWRAGLVKERLAEWRAAVQEHRPDAIVIANNCDVILRDTIGLFGFDALELSELQDALLVENVALPRYDAARSRLVANALPLKALRAAVPEKPILTVTYEHGIGIDGVPPARRLCQAIAEAAAVHAIPTLKGSEYLDGVGRFSVITAAAFSRVRTTLAPLLEWLHRNARLFEGVQHDPAVLVQFDPRATGADWPAQTQALTIGLALVRAQIPFAFTTNGAPGALFRDGQSPFTQRLSSRMLDLAVARRLVDPVLRSLARRYFQTVSMRRWLDRSGLTQRFLESPLFELPANWDSVRQLVPACSGPLARSDDALLVERWQLPDGRRRLHLVNYGEKPIEVALHQLKAPELFSPDAATTWLDAGHSRLRLDVYAVVECTP